MNFAKKTTAGSVVTEEKSDIQQSEWIEVVQRNVGSLLFGSVQVVIHDGRVTQVESVQKTRFSTSG